TTTVSSIQHASGGRRLGWVKHVYRLLPAREGARGGWLRRGSMPRWRPLAHASIGVLIGARTRAPTPDPSLRAGRGGGSLNVDLGWAAYRTRGPPKGSGGGGLRSRRGSWA